MFLSHHNLSGFGPSTSRSRNTTIIPIGLSVPSVLTPGDNSINNLSPNDVRKFKSVILCLSSWLLLVQATLEALIQQEMRMEKKIRKTS